MFSNFSINTNADFNNHWLTGFSDATASFQIQLITRTNQNQPVLSLPSRRGGIGEAGNKTPYPKALPETRIVVWGQNLSSSVGLGRFTKQVSNMIQIPAYQQSVITGLMLSDGWLIFGSKTSKYARLGFKQSLSLAPRLDYFWFVFSFLSPYCNSIPNLRSSYRKETKTYALEILTRSLPCFTELHAIYYPNGIKIIPADIFNLLTPIALAHWISGDGAKNQHGLTISTESFSVKDTIRLLNVLMIRYRLDCSLRKHSVGYIIYIKENSMPLLRTIVRPYMHSSMLYKLRINPDVKYTTQANNDSKGNLEEKEDKLNSLILQAEETKMCRNTCNKNNILKSQYDASFQIKILTRKHKKPEVRLNFQIDQKNNDLLILIKNFLGGQISYVNTAPFPLKVGVAEVAERSFLKGGKENYYVYNSISFSSAIKVIRYFDRYPLLSHKHVTYLKLRKTYCRIMANKDLFNINVTNNSSASASPSLGQATTLRPLFNGRAEEEGKKNNTIEKIKKTIKSIEKKRNYSTSSSSRTANINKLNPFWISGFSDAESTFSVSIFKNSKMKTGWIVSPEFSIELKQKDADLLHKIQSYFGVGTLRSRERIIEGKMFFSLRYTVRSINELKNIIIPHFLSFPLHTWKKDDFYLFNCIIEILHNKQHLTIEGVRQIISFKASMNKGLSKNLIESFYEITPSLKGWRNSHLTDDSKKEILNLNPYWIAGFFNGNGCFECIIRKSKTVKIGYQVLLRITLVQHSRDALLCNMIKEYWKIGYLRSDDNNSIVTLTVSNFKDIFYIVIPFFDTYNIQGDKILDYDNFRKIAILMKEKAHLTEEGFHLIKNLKSQMNRGRSMT